MLLTEHLEDTPAYAAALEWAAVVREDLAGENPDDVLGAFSNYCEYTTIDYPAMYLAEAVRQMFQDDAVRAAHRGMLARIAGKEAVAAWDGPEWATLRRMPNPVDDEAKDWYWEMYQTLADGITEALTK